MIRQLYIDHNHITLLVTLLCMVNTPESPHCWPVPVCHIRWPHFAAAIKCRDLVSGIDYSTVPCFGPLGRFWYSSLTALTPSNSCHMIIFAIWKCIYWFTSIINFVVDLNFDLTQSRSMHYTVGVESKFIIHIQTNTSMNAYLNFVNCRLNC